ncbi:CFS1-like protein [Auriscalpium vulgare]|uniref:CFS1-like protein n=1 Tax=Auriscalpium vulgare TaxID=40419 RepID=A0ACB8S4V6_9AGAM|nr:CFS1-like protein [Auriscalpium vulgare]
MAPSALLDTVHRYPRSLYSVADEWYRYATETILTASSSSLKGVAKAANIAVGRLRVETSDHTYKFRSEEGPSNSSTEPSAVLRVINDTFWIRLCAMSDLGFGEAFMYGDVECDDLIPVFLVFMYNKDRLSGLSSGLSWLFRLPQRVIEQRFLGTLGNSGSNISAHYDLSDDMFRAFLSSDMCYSCAIFAELDADLKDTPDLALSASQLQNLNSSSSSFSSGSSSSSRQVEDRSTPATPLAKDDLHSAQLRKVAHIAKKARIAPGHRVLDVGCGWGTLAMHVVRTVPGTVVDAITLSKNQYTHASARVAAAGLQDRVRVHLMDYREMPSEWDGAFDRVVSVGMAEHVGREYLGDYFAVLDRVMKRGSAVGVVQLITMPEEPFDANKEGVGFIGKWTAHQPSDPFFTVFPGGFLPSLTLLITALTSATSSRFVVDSVCNIGPHYARTLREWRRNFLARFDDTITKALQADHPEVFEGLQGERELAVFRRKWICACCFEAGFTMRWLNDHIVTFTREGDRTLACDTFE